MNNKIEALLSDLKNAKRNIETFKEGEEMGIAPQLNLLPKKANDALKSIVNLNKNYYEHLSKYGKSINKEF